MDVTGGCNPLVSVIMPVFNAASYLEESLHCISTQVYRPLEVIIFNDCSTDSSIEIISHWKEKSILAGEDIDIVILNSTSCNYGPGYGRNEAILSSNGSLICHFDADDMMLPERISEQVKLYTHLPDADDYLIGTDFSRFPENSTPYYSTWLEAMTNSDLILHKFRECTIICPTWLYSRKRYDYIASFRRSCRLRSRPESLATGTQLDVGFVESSSAALKMLQLSRIPEDLYFFLDHLELGGKLTKVPERLVTYRFTPGSWALGSKKQDLARVRCLYVESMFLCKATDGFMIWGYGKDGRKLLSSYLSAEMASRCRGFVDVSEKKIGMSYFIKHANKHVKVYHFLDPEVKPPLLICVGSKIPAGQLEANIALLNLTEGVDYYHFS